MIQKYGQATKLSPPISINGIPYSVGLKFLDPWRNRELTDSAIVTGQIQAVEDVTGNRKRIVCARSHKYSHITVVIGPGNSYEKRYPCLMGNSVASCEEPLRLSSAFEGTSTRGSDARTRAIPGDVLAFDDGKMFLIREANPYAVSPSSIAWQGSEHLPIVTYYEVECSPIVLDPGEFEEPQLMVYKGLPVISAEVDTATTPQALTRKIFQIEGTDVPDLYPDDAEFDAGQYQYWIDPNSFEIHVSSNNYLINGDGATYRFRYWVVDTSGFRDVEADQEFGVQSDDDTHGTSDQLYLVGYPTEGDSSETIDVLANGGKIGWRVHESGSTIPQQQECAVLGWAVNPSSGQAVVNWSGSRTTPGGSFSTGSIVSTNYDFPFQIQITKSANTITLKHRQNSSAAWTTADTITLSASVQTATKGLLYMTGEASVFTRFSIPSGKTLWTWGMNATGETATRQTEEFEVDHSQTFTIPGTTAITEVYNLTTDMSMDEYVSGSVNRSLYSISGNNLTVWCETSLDRLRVTQAAESGTPTAPGVPPRVFNITNFADGVTALSENRAHWRDELIVSDPDGAFDKVAGESFAVYRFAAFDPENPPSIQVCLFNGTSSVWETLSTDNYKADWVRGLILIRQSWIQGLSGPVCFRLFGSSFRHSCGFEGALAYNNLQKSIDVTDELYHEIGAAGTSVLNHYGQTSGLQPYPTALDGGGLPTGYAYGYTKGQVGTVCDRYKTHSSYPAGHDYEYFHLPAGIDMGGADGGRHIFYEEFAQGSKFYTSDIPVGESGLCVSGEFLVRGTTHSVSTYYPYFLFQAMTAPYPTPSVWFNMKVAGVPFYPNVAHIAAIDGVEIISAKCRVKMDSAYIKTWAMTRTTSPDLQDDEWEYIVNGESVAKYQKIGGTGGLLYNYPAKDVFTTGGKIGWALVASRQNTGSVFQFNDESLPMDYDASIYNYFGGGGVTVLPSGLYKVIDITELVKATVLVARSNNVNLFLWPTLASAAGSAGGGIAGYCSSNMPSHTLDFQRDGSDWAYSYETSGDMVYWDALTVDDFYVQYRLPSGAVRDYFLPVPLPAIPYQGA